MEPNNLTYFFWWKLIRESYKTTKLPHDQLHQLSQVLYEFHLKTLTINNFQNMIGEFFNKGEELNINFQICNDL